MKLYADLHIHSCLSPCAEDEMTPANICGMAYIKGLDVIALTDHNAARNLPAAAFHAARYGLTLLPGMEITTREEVHLLAYFPTVSLALEAGEYVGSRLPPLPNAPELFGRQLVMDENDEATAEEPRMLIGASDLSLEEAAAYVRGLGGAAVPAHVNRGANGLLMNLGFYPPGLSFPTVEITRGLPAPPGAGEGRLVLHDSDAHRLEDIAERDFFLEVAGQTPPDAAALVRLLRDGFCPDGSF